MTVLAVTISPNIDVGVTFNQVLFILNIPCLVESGYH